MSNPIDYSQGIYDAKKLGTPRLLILGAQHMFAMFGATVLVPLLTGLSVSTTLLCAPCAARNTCVLSFILRKALEWRIRSRSLW